MSKEEIPESWEDIVLVEDISSSTIEKEKTFKVKDNEEKRNQMGSFSSPTSVVFSPGQTAYIPQITKILGRVPQKCESNPATESTRMDQDKSFREKQRRYQEARDRIFQSPSV